MTEAVAYHFLDEGTAPLLDQGTVFDGPVRSDQLAAFISDPGHLMILAEHTGRVVGFASGTILLHPDKAAALFINEVGVETDMRRKGIARALIRRLMDEGRARGCSGFWLATETDNAAARALYRSLCAGEAEDVLVYYWDMKL